MTLFITIIAFFMLKDAHRFRQRDSGLHHRREQPAEALDDGEQDDLPKNGKSQYELVFRPTASRRANERHRDHDQEEQDADDVYPVVRYEVGHPDEHPRRQWKRCVEPFEEDFESR